MTNIIIEASETIINEMQTTIEIINFHTHRIHYKLLEIDVISNFDIEGETLKFSINNNIIDNGKKKTIQIKFDVFNNAKDLRNEKIFDLFEKAIIIRNGETINPEFNKCNIKYGDILSFSF